MIRSMTGYGRGETEHRGHRFQAEVRAVNHRFLNTRLRIPREFSHLESRLAAVCSARVERGHLDITVSAERVGGGAVGGPRLDRDVLDRYLTLIEALDAHPGIDGRVSAEALLGLEGVVVWEQDAIDLGEEAFLEGAETALTEALDALGESRAAEGAALEADLRSRMESIEGWRSELVALAPEREARERERLRAKVVELLETMDADLEARVAQEIAILADRTDVSEELTRMRAHLDQFAVELDGEAVAVGRKLAFLLQELVREANTVAAKANDPEMQRAAIEIKADVEKMREQAENVE